jgi:hypothetical protein
MYAPLYHSLAELEARICNLEALARLNKRTAELFHSNALDSTPHSLSDNAFGSRIRSSHLQPRHGGSSASSRSSSSGVSALAEKIGSDGDDENDDDDDDDDGLSMFIGEDIDPMLTIESLGRRNIMMMDDDTLIGDFLDMETS